MLEKRRNIVSDGSLHEARKAHTRGHHLEAKQGQDHRLAEERLKELTRNLRKWFQDQLREFERQVRGSEDAVARYQPTNSAPCRRDSLGSGAARTEPYEQIQDELLDILLATHLRRQSPRSASSLDDLTSRYETHLAGPPVHQLSVPKLTRACRHKIIQAHSLLPVDPERNGRRSSQERVEDLGGVAEAEEVAGIEVRARLRGSKVSCVPRAQGEQHSPLRAHRTASR